MAGFQYYLPGGGPQPNAKAYFEQLVKYGLETVIDGTTGTFLGVDHGPDGGRGVVLAPQVPGRTPARIGYYADQQRWVKSGECWTGMYKDDNPGPEDLARDVGLQTFPVKLNDGNEWDIPLAYYQGSPALPKVRRFDDGGNIVHIIDSCFERLAILAAPIFDYLCTPRSEGDEDKAVSWDNPELYELAVVALGYTYHVGKTESVLLEIPRDDFLWSVAYAVVGFSTARSVQDALEDSLKKNNPALTPDISGGECGTNGGSTDTDQPVPMSGS